MTGTQDIELTMVKNGYNHIRLGTSGTSLPWGREGSIGQNTENCVYRSEGNVYVRWEESLFLHPLDGGRWVSALVLLQEAKEYNLQIFDSCVSFGVAGAALR